MGSFTKKRTDVIMQISKKEWRHKRKDREKEKGNEEKSKAYLRMYGNVSWCGNASWGMRTRFQNPGQQDLD